MGFIFTSRLAGGRGLKGRPLESTVLSTPSSASGTRRMGLGGWYGEGTDRSLFSMLKSAGDPGIESKFKPVDDEMPKLSPPAGVSGGRMGDAGEEDGSNGERSD